MLMMKESFFINSTQVKNVPLGATFYDIDFDPAKPEHGYIVGAKGTFLETNDGGDTWTPRYWMASFFTNCLLMWGFLGFDVGSDGGSSNHGIRKKHMLSIFLSFFLFFCVLLGHSSIWMRKKRSTTVSRR